jgi:hypothetical protein
MKTQDYAQRIESYYRANPGLDRQELAVLLTADLLYEDVPEDLPAFHKKYAHLDPDVLERPFESIAFLKIAHSDEPESRLRERLNAYLNIKFHDIVHSKSYEENAPIFKHHSQNASRFIDEILEKAALPGPLVAVLRERDEVRACHDFYDMLQLYRQAGSRTVRYELMRKLGLIVLIARINRSVEFEALANRMHQVRDALQRGLGWSGGETQEYFFWLNAADRIEFATDRLTAEEAHERQARRRVREARPVHPPQRIECRGFRTFSGNEIVHMELRNKFESSEEPCYTSFIEKMLRKNLEFPNQIHDTIGVKIVVNSEEEIPRIIADLESFLGGSSTRKMEKNSYHRFGRLGLSEYSSKEYFVWKAIYDITLPHPSIAQTDKMLEITRDNARAQEELLRRREHFVNNPRDFVIEVQLQDIRSFLLSISRGSPTEHAWLKMNQIRSNSLYKIFPEQVFEEEITRLRSRLLDSQGG